MTEKLDKIFNAYSLIFINIAIIILTLTAGGGKLSYLGGVYEDLKEANKIK